MISSNSSRLKMATRLIVLGALLLSSGLPIAAAAKSPATVAQTGAPILLVLNDTPADPYGAYLAEILRYEGLNAFDTINLNDITAGTLSQYSLVVLAPTALSAAQATMFNGHVSTGQRLIAFKPDAGIRATFGLGVASGSLANGGYIKFTPGARITPVSGRDEFLDVDAITQTLQVKAAIEQYALDPGANEIARVFSDATTPTAFPAVAAKGRAVAFTYDLARAVAYQRQGRTSGLTAAGLPVTRTQELYDKWVDLDRVSIPQADEQIRLLARIVHSLSTDGMAVPQTWYFPNAAKSVLLPTSDAHANPRSYFDTMVNTVNGAGGKVTLFSSIGDSLSKTLISNYTAQGHAVGLLIYANRVDTSYGIANLSQGFSVMTGYYTNTYALQPSSGYRSFDNAWDGWSRGAEIAAQNGYRMDFNAMHIGAWLRKPSGSWARGHLTGGGRPLPFVKSDGVVLNVYQQPTQISDQQLMPVTLVQNFEGLALPAGGIKATRGIIDASVMSDYAALALNSNIDYTFPDAMFWLSDTITYAASQGVPSMSADQWIRFNDVRRAARYNNVAYDAGTGTLSFNMVVSSTPDVSLTVMLPSTYRGRSIESAQVDGNAAALTIDLIKQSNYGLLQVPTANHTFTVRYAQDTPLSGLAVASSSPAVLRAPVYFTATVTAGSNVRYVWNFGDGSFGAGATISHTYAIFPASGTYSVTVNARNGENSAQAATLVVLSLPPTAYLPLARKSP